MNYQEILELFPKKVTALEQNLKNNLVYINIWQRAKLYLTGEEEYKRLFSVENIPINWNHAMLKDISEQIISELRGCSQGNPIIVSNRAHIHQILALFQYEIVAFEMISEIGFVRVIAMQNCNEQQLALCFIIV
jgi:hypothetical protein